MATRWGAPGSNRTGWRNDSGASYPWTGTSTTTSPSMGSDACRSTWTGSHACRGIQPAHPTSTRRVAAGGPGSPWLGDVAADTLHEALEEMASTHSTRTTHTPGRRDPSTVTRPYAPRGTQATG